MTGPERSQRARVAALSKSAQATTPEARSALTSAARAAREAQFHVASDEELSPTSRRRIVAARKHLHLIAMANQSAQARRLRTNQKRRPGRHTKGGNDHGYPD